MADLPALPLSVASPGWQHNNKQMVGRVKEGNTESSTDGGHNRRSYTLSSGADFEGGNQFWLVVVEIRVG